LASDIGEKLGCWGHLAALRRVSSGPFTIGEAVSPDELAADAEKGVMNRHLISCFSALSHLRSLTISGSGAERIARGISPAEEEFEEYPASGLETAEMVRISRGETLLAVAQNSRKDDGDRENLRLLRVFNEL
jgi:tRNA pseudouridine55 synthase